ncbi:unnamed protein product [Anisakis simplex]|uniref:BPI2 domain-containing protein n=1 Tax=Anisakis simplex TaxID=6269 RepID=A0A0M3J4X0_ANISI|nr:unnamed protein product [Anisakis simplex]
MFFSFSDAHDVVQKCWLPFSIRLIWYDLFSRAASLHLEYGLVDDPIVNEFGLELNCSGEVSENGKGATPFGAAPMQLLSMQNSTPMLQIVVSDYVTNSLMYHGHKIGLFNTRVDPSSPQIGPVLRTTCGLGSGPLFCLGDILPTLRQYHPNKSIAMDFRSVQQPILIYRSSPEGFRFKTTHLIIFFSDNLCSSQLRICGFAENKR